MKYVSIDIETTGLDREVCQVLEISVVIEDTRNLKPVEELPHLDLIIEHDTIVGQPYAINMNARIFKILAEMQDIKDKAEREAYRRKHNIVGEKQVTELIWTFLYTHGFGESYMTNSMDAVTYDELKASANPDIRIPVKKEQLKVTVAGKNFPTFDKVFLERIENFTKLIRFRQRILDPCTDYVDFMNDDDAPNMEACFRKLGLPQKTSHIAYDDAIDVIRLLRPLYNTYDRRMMLMRGNY